MSSAAAARSSDKAAAGSTAVKNEPQTTASSSGEPSKESASSTSATAAAEESTNGDATTTVDSMDADLLPVIHDIVRTIERDNQDVSQKNKDSLEASQKIQSVHAKIAALREAIYRLPGVETGPEEQQRRLDVLRRQIEAKTRLIQKYKELNLKVSGLTASTAGGGGGGAGSQATAGGEGGGTNS